MEGTNLTKEVHSADNMANQRLYFHLYVNSKIKTDSLCRYITEPHTV
jgi:hypothetical protein